MSTINWILTNGFYQIDSVNHLLCLMNNGSGFTATNAPSTYRTANYIQRIDIDLAGKTVIPIGTSTAAFTGTYDGATYQIKNYTYNSSNTSYQGLFGYCSNATLKNICLSGTWNLTGISYMGFLAGYVISSTVVNIKVVMSGSKITATDTAIGGIIGYSATSTISNLIISGTMISISSVNGPIGGVIGVSWYDVCMQFVANYVVYTAIYGLYLSPAGNYNAGGVLGMSYQYNGGSSTPCQYIVNNMVGNIYSSNQTAAGIFAHFETHTTNPTSYKYIHNGMRGNITANQNYVGGIMGATPPTGHNGTTISYITNYMRGNITGGSQTGGFAGNSVFNGTVNNVIVAIRGTITGGSLYGTTGSTIYGTNYYTTALGGSASSTTGSTSSTITGLSSPWMYHANLPELPYAQFTGTDVLGNTVCLHLDFPNVNGLSKYSTFDKFVISAGDVTAGDFSLTKSDNVYSTYYLHQYQANNPTYGSVIYISNVFPVSSYKANYVLSYSGVNLGILRATYTVTKPTTSSSNDGSITLTIYDGTGPFTYLWSDGSTYKNLINASNGTYSVIITDSNGIKCILDNIILYNGVYWITSGSSYIVSSKDHLLCIMNQGSGFSTSGSVPSNYLTASYVQSANIDLVSDSRIKPIGTTGSNFTGTYNGSYYNISNWSYTNTGLIGLGLFGCISTNAYIQNIVLTGTWYASGSGGVGFCVGQINGTSTVTNIKAIMTNSQIIANARGAGGLIGLVAGGLPSLINLSISGTMLSINSTAELVGGILGGTNTTVNVLSHCINNVVFLANPAITGTDSLGGIVGNLIISSSYVCSNLINNMVGNIVCNGSYVGGIGVISNSSGAILNNFYVSMTGNIQGYGQVTAITAINGGILSNCIVSMRGNIVSTTGSTTSVIQGATNSTTNVYVAIAGSLTNLQTSTGSFTKCYYDTSCGMTVGNTANFTNITGSSSLTSPFTYHIQMPAIPYIPINSYETNNNVFNYSISYPNIANNASYNSYERFVISPGNVDAGKFQLNKNDNVYTKYYLHKFKNDNSLYIDPSFVVTFTSVTTVYDYNNPTAKVYPIDIKISYSISNVSIPGQSNGSIYTLVSGAYFPVTYKWNINQTSNNISNLATGYYNLNVSDSLSNYGSLSNLFVAEPVSTNIVSSNVFPYGNNNAYINVTPAGGYSIYNYLWNTGSTSQNISNLTAGSYNLIIKSTGSNSSSSTYTYTLSNIVNITQPIMKLNVNQTNYCSSLLCSWTNSINTYFQIKYKINADSSYVATNIFTPTSNNQFEITQLRPNTIYDLQLYSGNDPANINTIADTKQINTSASTTTITMSNSYYDGFDIAITANNYQGTYLMIKYKLSIDTQWQAYPTNITSNIIRIRNLVSNTSYDLQLYGSYNKNGSYVPLTTNTFTTLPINSNKNYQVTLNYLINTARHANFGIGTSNPTKKLDVVGDVNLSGDLYNNYQKLGLWNLNDNIYYNAGQVGVASSAPSYTLDINGIAKAGNFITTSDARLKKDIVSEYLGLDYINSLKPRTFNFTDNTLTRHGFIAQEILETTPNSELIDTDSNGYYTFNTLGLLSPIVKAIQELDNNLQRIIAAQ